jgi:hypothetical protein
MTPRFRSKLVALCALFLATAPAWADGTVSFESDIRPLLKAKPAFEKFVLGTLKIDDAGSGVRISDQAMPHLGGARMGPYEFRAVWHSASGDVPVTLIVDTDIKFLGQGRAGDHQRLAEAGGEADGDVQRDRDCACALSANAQSTSHAYETAASVRNCRPVDTGPQCHRPHRPRTHQTTTGRFQDDAKNSRGRRFAGSWRPGAAL